MTKKIKCNLSLALTLTFAIYSAPVFSQPVVHTTDFINDADRTGFNGFEEYTDRVDMNTTHTEGNIRVERTGAVSDVWTTLGAEARSGFEGAHSWYPEPVLSYPIQTGYDKITLESGGAFNSIGMLVGSGSGGYCLPNDCDIVASYLSLHYELLFQGNSVATGVLAHHPNAHYIGFSGGGFDEVRIWDRSQYGWPDQNALLIDSIEIASIGSTNATVPEPKALALMFSGLILLSAFTRRKRTI